MSKKVKKEQVKLLSEVRELRRLKDKGFIVVARGLLSKQGLRELDFFSRL